MTNSALNPYATPVAAVAEATLEGHVELAERLTRLWAFLLDTMVWVGMILIGLLIMMGFPALGILEPFLGMTIGVTWLSLGVLGIMILNIFWLHRYGQTIGKRFLQIKIVRPGGERASTPRLLFLRTFVPGLISAIPLIGNGFWLVDQLYILREQRRCLHDLIADTIVIKTPGTY